MQSEDDLAVAASEGGCEAARELRPEGLRRCVLWRWMSLSGSWCRRRGASGGAVEACVDRDEGSERAGFAAACARTR